VYLTFSVPKLGTCDSAKGRKLGVEKECIQVHSAEFLLPSDVPIIRKDINQDKFILQLDCDLVGCEQIIYSAIYLISYIYSHFSVWYKHLECMKYHTLGC